MSPTERSAEKHAQTPFDLLTTLAVLVTLSLVACKSPAPEPQAVAGPRLENADLGLALATVPAGFDVESSDGEGIQLDGNSPATAGGTVTITSGPIESGGVNLVAESQARIDRFAEIGGSSFGSRELQGPIGTAFTVRGRRPVESGEVEETWIYAIHPITNRLVTLVYEYPAGEDTQARIGQVLEVFGEVEGLPRAAE